MDEKRQLLYQCQVAEDEFKGNRYHWINICLASLLIMGLGLLGGLFVLRFMSTNLSGADTTTVDTIPSAYVPERSIPNVTRPSELPRPHTTNASVTTPRDQHHVPTPLEPFFQCGSCACRSLGQRIREKLDYSVDPCTDFYQYVCNSFRGHSEFNNVLDSIALYTLLRVTVPHIPSSNQLSWQKAAGMYHACLNFVTKYEPETQYLVKWLVSLDMDLLSHGNLSSLNPIKMMVRGSLEFGVPVMIFISFNPKEFRGNKRKLQLEYAGDRDSWESFKLDLIDYAQLMIMFGATPPYDKIIGQRIKAYDNALYFIERITLNKKEFEPIRLNQLGNITEPYVPSEQWSTFISLYTNNTYTAADYIYYQEAALQILLKVYKDMGETSLRYLVAWKFFWHLVQYTEPYIFLYNRPASEACFEQVTKLMPLAVLNPFFQSEIPPHMLADANKMVKAIREAYLMALQSSSWLSNDFRQASVKKINDMVSYVGSPGQRLNPDFVEAYYKRFPDVPLDLDLLFPTWLKVLGLSAQYMWIDTTTPLFEETRRTPFYAYAINAVAVPAASMLRPFMYPYGVDGLNYGGLGTMIGHAMMGALDPIGIQSLDGYVPNEKDEVMKEYTKRALCLRKSRNSLLSLSAQKRNLSEEVDSENLANLVGTKTAYDAFHNLERGYRDQYLAGLEMTGQQLFFFNYCAKMCAEDNAEVPLYETHRLSCIVPLMNMKEFSSAFGCAAKTPMNPQEKCVFW